jgi:16S rRNA (cytosine967-C5)-methyltransferase
MSKGTQNSRRVAADIVGRWLRTEHFPDRLIVNGTPDRPFVVEVVYGTVRQRRLLEWVIRRCADRAPDNRVLPYLLVGAYQLLCMDTVAPYAAVNETVEAAKGRLGAGVAAFVNGVLRRIDRERTALRSAAEQESPALASSHPDLLTERWTEAFGVERTAALCAWNNRPADVVVVPNPLKTNLQDFRASLADAGVNAAPHPFRPEQCLVLPRGARVGGLPGYGDGLFSVHDPSTLVAVELLDARPGQLVLDACSAPGGKAMLTAERMRDEGQVIALDLYRDRLATLENNLERMGFNCVTAAEGNAAVADDIVKACGSPRFDRILLDVPCSNTGVLRRRPDARWRVTEERITQLSKLQAAILEQAAAFLEPAGRLVYSTCSLEPEENDGVVDAWLATHDAWTCVERVHLFPPETETDGVFAAALARRDPGPPT